MWRDEFAYEISCIVKFYNWNVFCITMGLMYQMFGHKIWAWIDKVHYVWEDDI
jgi:hypothetical protein